MSENEINDVNSCDDCGSCDGGDNVNNSGGGDGGDSPCCDSGNSHKQADLKMLVFVLVLILAGAVAAHSLLNKDKDAGACGPGGCSSESEQVGSCPSTGAADQMPSGTCPISGKSSAGEDASIKQCSTTVDDVEKVFESGKTASPCCPVSEAVKETK